MTLINERAVAVTPSLVRAFGPRDALLLQQVYWVTIEADYGLGEATRAWLAGATGLTKNQVVRSIEKLVSLGVLEVFELDDGNPGMSRQAYEVDVSKVEEIVANTGFAESHSRDAESRSSYRGIAKPSSPQESLENNDSVVLADELRSVFDAWAATQKKPGACKLTDKRKGVIKKRLKDGYSVEFLVRAVRGWQFDEWEGRKDHNDLLVLLRDENVERMALLGETTAAKNAVESPVGSGADTVRESWHVDAQFRNAAGNLTGERQELATVDEARAAVSAAKAMVAAQAGEGEAWVRVWCEHRKFTGRGESLGPATVTQDIRWDIWLPGGEWVQA